MMRIIRAISMVALLLVLSQASAANDADSELWRYVGDRITLSDTSHPESIAWAKRFARYPADLRNSLQRAEPYLWHIVQAVEARQMPIEIALLPFVESDFEPFAYSSGRASGLWQIVPVTADRFELRRDWWVDERRDLLRSTTAALDYLQYLHDLFDDWLLAVAAYNSGEGRIRTAIRRNISQGKPFRFWNIRIPSETRGYVPKLLGFAELLKHPQRYGVSLAPLPNEPRIVSVKLPGQIDLAVASRLSETDVKELHRLNPALNRWATHPEGPHQLFVPAEVADRFRAAVTELPLEQRLKLARHLIQPGDTLGLLAEKYGTTINHIRQLNGIDGQRIVVGRTLRIATSTLGSRAYPLSAEQRRLARLQRSRKGQQRVQHTVRRGDTLWDIARSYDVSTSALARWNGMAPRDVLRPGRVLIVWPGNAAAAGSVAETRLVHYVVRRGDSLYVIARRFGVALNDLRRWNQLSLKKPIFPGQKLKVFVSASRETRQT